MFKKISRGFYVRDGIYYYKFKLKGHKAICRSTEIRYDGKVSTQDIAFSKFQKVKLEAEKNGIYDRPTKITIVKMFSDYLDIYVKGRSEYAKSGIPAKKYFNEYFKEKDATTVSDKDFMQFRIWCRDEKFLANGTINRYLGLLHTCYERMKKQLKLNSNPLAEIESLPTAPRRRIASNMEIDGLWQNLSLIMKDVLIFEIATGIRKGEIRRLEWSHVQFRGAEDSYIQIPINKENNPYKIVALNKDALEILNNRFSKKLSNYVFCDEEGIQLKNDGLIRTEFNRIKKKLGIEKLTFHDLRHNFGTQMVEDSGNIHAASKQMGHSSVTVTDKIYSHARIKYLGREVNKMKSHLSRIAQNSENVCHSHVTVNFRDANISRKYFSIN